MGLQQPTSTGEFAGFLVAINKSHPFFDNKKTLCFDGRSLKKAPEGSFKKGRCGLPGYGFGYTLWIQVAARNALRVQFGG